MRIAAGVCVLAVVVYVLARPAVMVVGTILSMTGTGP